MVLATDKTRPNNLFLPLIVCLISTACQPLSANINEQTIITPTPSVQIATQITEPHLSPTATPMCTALPEGVTLSVTPDSSASIPRMHVEMSGLQPGEHLTLVFYTDVAGQNSIRIEEFPAQPIGEDGRFERWEQLTPPEGATSAHWQIQIIHAHGVACTDLTLP